MHCCDPISENLLEHKPISRLQSGPTRVSVKIFHHSKGYFTVIDKSPLSLNKASFLIDPKRSDNVSVRIVHSYSVTLDTKFLMNNFLDFTLVARRLYKA